jgi:hypothetical protein
MITVPTGHLAWLLYVAAAVVYTMLEFGVSFTNVRTPIFSARNARPAYLVIWTHLVFLAILMELLWLSTIAHTSLYNSLPGWTTVNISRGDTTLDLVSLLLVLILGKVERRFIFVESGESDRRKSAS